MNMFHLWFSLLGVASTLAWASNLAVTFHDCGDASTDAVVKDVTPKSITTGASNTITGSGTLKKDVTGGTYTMTMTGLLGVSLVKNCNGDASKANTCDITAPLYGKVGSLEYQPVTFPIKAGDISGIPKVGVTLKAGMPAKLEATTTTLKFTGSDGDKVICVQIMTKAMAVAPINSDTNSQLFDPTIHLASNALPRFSTPAALGGSLAVSFHDCGDASTDAVVKDITPKSITTGASNTITGSGTLKKDVTGGTYTMTMTGLLGVSLIKNCNGDASKGNTCDITAPLYGKVGSLEYQPVTFPIKAGDISGIPKVGVTLKAGMPAKLEATTTTLKVTGSDGDQVICVQIMTKASAGDLIIV